MFNNKVQRYSIRKLTVGAASVLIGMAFLTNSNQAKAADGEQNSTSNDVKAVTDSHQEVNTASAKDLEGVVVETSAKADVQDPEIKKADNVAEQSLEIAKETPTSTQALSESKAQTQNTPKQQTVAKATEQKKDSTTDPAKEAHKVTISFIDDYTGKAVQVWQPGSNKYETVNPLSGEFKVGDTVEFDHEVYREDGSHYTATTRVGIYDAIAGYKLVNMDEINKKFPKRTEFNSPIMTADHDITLTYHYAPLADTLVKYVDADTGSTLAHLTFPNRTLNVAYKNTPASNYEAVAINIPGYELVSAPVIEGKIQDDQIKTKGNPNPTVLVFKYKKVTQNAVPQDINLNKNIGGVALSDTNWGAIPGMFTIMRDSKTGGSITTDGRSVEKAHQELIDRYINQGFTYAGTSGKVLDNEPYNSISDGTHTHLVPNLPVTVNYVDEAGNKLAAEDTIAFNKNNPNQKNNGIDEKNYWHPAGEWSTKPKEIKGYDLIRTEGAEKGKFTLFAYNVTYVYAKHVDGGIKYIDDTTKEELANATFNGKVGDKIDYTTADKIANYEKQGYKLKSNNFEDGKSVFAKDGNQFEVHLVHKIEDKKDNKTITRVVNYVDENGNKVAESVTQTVTVNGKGSVDQVTGEYAQPMTWTEDNFTEVDTPSVKDYHVTNVSTAGNVYYSVDKDGNVSSTKVTHENGDTVVTVHFAKDKTPTPQPSNPAPTPTPNPSNPTQPTESVTPQPETPETPQTPDTPSDHEETVTPHASNVPEDNDDNTEETVRPHAATPEKQVTKKAAVVKTVAKAEAQTLPQTGEENDDAAAAAGLAMFGAISLIGLAGIKKRKN